MPATVPQAVQSCHDLLLWIIPQLDKFPRSRRFTLGERIETGLSSLTRISVVRPSTSSGRTYIFLKLSCFPVRAELVEAWEFSLQAKYHEFLGLHSSLRRRVLLHWVHRQSRKTNCGTPGGGVTWVHLLQTSCHLGI